MTAAQIAAHLLSRCPSLANYEAYMFGSTLRGVGVDADILIVGLGGDALVQLKAEMRYAGENLPLHVLYMLPSEERGFDFVIRERCVALAQVVAAGNRSRALKRYAGGSCRSEISRMTRTRV